jgi:hypothetical protein
LRGRCPLFIVMVFVFLGVLPCYAYGDPSGGVLFQILMPVLAALWGMWLIFANNIRRRSSNLLRKWRGKPEKNADFAEVSLPEPSSSQPTGEK